MNIQSENYLDDPLGASPSLDLCYPLYGIGSGLGGSLPDSPLSSLGDRLLSWLGGWLGGGLGSELEYRLGGGLRGCVIIPPCLFLLEITITKLDFVE